MMLKGGAFSWGLQVVHQVILPISGDSMAQRVILHPSANVYGVYLHESQMIQRRPNIWESSIQTSGKAHESASRTC